ncbi:class I SAM-dependent methyltransferase [Bacillus sinesaloumensis]|uniref:class I SAM-dependent methyltransferase n=1 Tax=Litchfieldia sinesaloumensis TaxID=1926280 RepID=UPI000988438E|nr:class I SAM-dependent methyltransferase [Bacillus sinesaloumensis]
MLDKEKIDSFFERRTEISNPNIATHYKEDDTIQFDIALIDKYIDSSSTVLDLGCGPGRITNLLEPKVFYIKAVDKQKAFLEYCTNSPKVETVESELTEFNDDSKYNVILLFGIMNYFDDEDVKKIYKNCFSMLKNNGVIIVKHASGINKDVIVDKYSEQIGDWYHAIYRHVVRDDKLLRQSGFEPNIIDIYPERLNPWENTHYYAFVAKKKSY